jgi:hypothetical protein
MNDYQRYGADLDSASQFGVEEFDCNSRRVRPVFFLPIILASGLITTALVFVAVYLINFYGGRNVLALLINFVIPVGAVIGGILGGVGYAVSSRILQFLPDKKFIAFICLLQFLVFFASRYSEYTIAKHHVMNHVAKRLINQHVGDNGKIIITDQNGETKEMNPDEFVKTVQKQFKFIDFYRQTIEETQWASVKRPNEKPYKLGKLGWLIEIWTAVVFAICSNVPLFILASFAYCKQCRRFMRKRIDFTFPARAPIRKIKKNDDEATQIYLDEDKEQLAYATKQISEIEEFLSKNIPVNRNDFFKFLSEKQNNIKTETANIKGRIPNVIRIIYTECYDCNNFKLIAKLQIQDVSNALPGEVFLQFENGIFVTEFNPPNNDNDDNTNDVNDNEIVTI